ncbi:MAG: serine/threonine-protein kinase [Phycisphaerae bacterium]|nr:serine/threonine-protein kinase [Phycisphaerae bacterium]
MTSGETNYDTMFGKIAVEQGLCSETEISRAMEELNSRRKISPITLKDLMLDLGYITSGQALRLQQSLRETKSAAHQIPGYKILGKLGAGAMAIVYKGMQLSLNRPVAIKVLPKRLSENPEYVQRFYKEGQLAAKLNHNNIVQAYDVGEAGGYHYFVMEYVEGKTLYDDLAKGKVFGETEALDIIIQVAHALAHAHAKGLIHRDVKPKNIMITTAGVVKLADMGLARGTADIEAAKTEAGKAYGTPYYIAPEQIRGEIDIDGRADIYGLGATLYHLVTGRVPFMADDPTEVMKKHLREPLIPPDHINITLSAGISEVVEVMMAKRREERYANAKELIADLEAVRNGQPPMLARKEINVSMLEKLQEGEAVEIDEEDAVSEETLAHYRVAVIILSVVAVIFLMVIVLMMIS